MQHNFFQLLQINHYYFGDAVFEELAAVQLVVRQVGIGAVHNKVQHARQHVFAVLFLQKLFQIVVAKPCVFNVNFADDADLDFFFRLLRQSGKVFRQCFGKLLHRAGGLCLAFKEGVFQFVQPFVGQFIHRTFDGFVRAGSVGKVHQCIAVNNGRHKFFQHGQVQLKARLCVHAVHVQAYNRDIAEACFFHALAQQVNIVGGTAAAARLRKDNGGFFKVVFSAFQRADNLPDNEQRGVANITVDVFQSRFDNFASGVLQNFCLVAAALQCRAQKREMKRQHTRYKYGMRGFHLFCKNRQSVF